VVIDPRAARAPRLPGELFGPARGKALDGGTPVLHSG
jgi:hypothetical protein